MKQKSYILLLILLLISLCGLTACTLGNGEETEETGFTLFFDNEEGTELYTVSVNREDFPDYTGAEELLEILLTELQSPSHYSASEDPKATLYSVIPEGMMREAEVQTLFAEGFDAAGQQSDIRTARVMLSRDYLSLETNRRALLRTGISQSILSTGQFNEVELLIPSDNGETYVPVDLIYQSDRTMLNTYEEGVYNDEVRVTLYFMNPEKNALVGEERVLKLGFTEPLSEAIVRALIDGPTESELLPTIPTGTYINKILVEDGICYVDLSQEFQLNHEGGELLEKLTIYSIVNSLDNVSSIHYVQFLIDGERVDYYKTYVSLDQLLTPDTSLYEINE